MNDWERMITVDFVPGLGGMKEESELLETVNDMMSDILDMGEVGWLKSIGMTESSQYYRIDESLVGVPRKSAFVLFYHVNSNIQYEVSMSWLFI